MRIEPKNIVPDLPNLRPFDFSFKPVPNLTTTNSPICPYSEIGIDVVVTKPLEYVTSPTSFCGAASPSNQSALAVKHLKEKERGKLMRNGAGDGHTQSVLSGEDIIQYVYDSGKVLIPLAVSPDGDIGPMYKWFLFGTPMSDPYTFPNTRTQANKMYTRAMSHPSPHNIIGLATANWKKSKRPSSSPFYGHSYTAPTPKEWYLQEIGRVISDAIALHIRDVKLGHITSPSSPLDEDFDPTIHGDSTTATFDFVDADAILQGAFSAGTTFMHSTASTQAQAQAPPPPPPAPANTRSNTAFWI